MRHTLPTITLALVLLSPATAAPPVAPVVKALGLARDLADAVPLLDRLTAVKGRPAVRTAHGPTFEGLELSARFRVPGVEVRDHISNEVFGLEVPGRHVEVVIKVDCVVRCTIDPGAIEIAPDPDYPDTVVLTLPPVRVSADFAEEADAEFEVEYGRLRNRWLDGEKAAELRREMYAAAKRQATETFGAEALPASRDELARELEKLLRKKFPDKRIYVRGGR
jgi:hypothetical protein